MVNHSHRGHPPQSTDDSCGGEDFTDIETRTPQAWQQRDHGGGRKSRRSSEPGSEQIRRRHMSDHHQQQQQPYLMDENGQIPAGFYPSTPSNSRMVMASNGSVRSMHSMPLVAAAPPPGGPMGPAVPTWDGEPCPVHHAMPATMMPLAALYGLGVPPTAYSLTGPPAPPSLAPSVVSASTTLHRARSIAELSNLSYAHGGGGGGRHGGPQLNRAVSVSGDQFFPAGGVVITENGALSTLPRRDMLNYSTKSTLSTAGDAEKGGSGGKDAYKGTEGYLCCSGHLLVLWIVMGIVTFGILLAILLRLTID